MHTASTSTSSGHQRSSLRTNLLTIASNSSALVLPVSEISELTALLAKNPDLLQTLAARVQKHGRIPLLLKDGCTPSMADQTILNSLFRISDLGLEKALSGKQSGSAKLEISDLQQLNSVVEALKSPELQAKIKTGPGLSLLSLMLLN